jgi:hypothetical protein
MAKAVIFVPKTVSRKTHGPSERLARKKSSFEPVLLRKANIPT